MKKRISLVLALVLILTLLMPAALAKGQYLGYLTVVNCDSWVTLRSRASTSAGTVSRVPLGATVEAYYYNSEFTECYYLGMHGYILSTYLSGSSYNSGSTSSYLGKMYIVNCDNWVTLRSYASTSAPAITRIAKGLQVDAYYYNGTFCRCIYNGMEGYILSQYLGTGNSNSYNGSFMGNMRIVNCDSWVTLRSAPSTSASTVTRVPWGEVVEAYYYNSQFAECYYNGLHGYILMRYLG